ncbi:MAG: hypothetical protein GY874_22150 [Desulfobacteraceae bacterium]|nr:hypothetical protein [Desulfobacteraceae bacterium]
MLKAKLMTGVLIVFLIPLCASAESVEYWTVKAQNGVIANADGKVLINIGNYQPTGPNPADTVWSSCKSNWIHLHVTADGTEVEKEALNRMLSIAIVAFKTNSRIRVAITRDSLGKCYSSQIFDVGE